MVSSTNRPGGLDSDASGILVIRYELFERVPPSRVSTRLCVGPHLVASPPAQFVSRSGDGCGRRRRPLCLRGRRRWPLRGRTAVPVAVAATQTTTYRAVDHSGSSAGSVPISWYVHRTDVRLPDLDVAVRARLVREAEHVLADIGGAEVLVVFHVIPLPPFEVEVGGHLRVCLERHRVPGAIRGVVRALRLTLRVEHCA